MATAKKRTQKRDDLGNPRWAPGVALRTGNFSREEYRKLYSEFKIICLKEGKQISTVLWEFIDEYVRKHGGEP